MHRAGRDKVTGDVKGKGGAIGQEGSPLDKAKASDVNRAIGGVNSAPGMIDRTVNEI